MINCQPGCIVSHKDVPADVLSGSEDWLLLEEAEVVVCRGVCAIAGAVTAIGDTSVGGGVVGLVALVDVAVVDDVDSSAEPPAPPSEHIHVTAKPVKHSQTPQKSATQLPTTLQTDTTISH